MKQIKEDDALFTQIQSGDESAFKKLFTKYYRPLCYTAYKVYQDEHKSKDFVQEVFLDLWKRREHINIKTSLYGFLRRAVVNKTIDYIRSQRFDFSENPILPHEKVTRNSPLELGELQSIIHHTVDQLPNRCRIIFSMSRFEEMSHREIATQLGISEKTIENQITKALKVLRKVVQAYGVEIKICLIYFLML